MFMDVLRASTLAPATSTTGIPYSLNGFDTLVLKSVIKFAAVSDLHNVVITAINPAPLSGS